MEQIAISIKSISDLRKFNSNTKSEKIDPETFETFNENTCVQIVGNNVLFEHRQYYIRKGFKIISVDEYFKLNQEGITSLDVDSNSNKSTNNFSTTDLLKNSTKTNVTYDNINKNMEENKLASTDKHPMFQTFVNLLVNLNRRATTWTRVKKVSLSSYYVEENIPKPKYKQITELLEKFGLLFIEGERSGMSYKFQFPDGYAYKDIQNIAQKLCDLYDEIYNKSNTNKRPYIRKQPVLKKESNIKLKLLPVGSKVYLLYNDSPCSGVIRISTGIFDDITDKLTDCKYTVKISDKLINVSSKDLYQTKDELFESIKLKISKL